MTIEQIKDALEEMKLQCDDEHDYPMSARLENLMIRIEREEQEKVKLMGWDYIKDQVKVLQTLEKNAYAQGRRNVEPLF